ncbi:MAG TPA: hypothetical protein VFE01_11465 [Terracidiphilus sp.]|jgi:hypothetical protein|nr:hypothetical protein [Terracidiphilus sp.]
METLLRIRESSPSELFADRLEREAQRAATNNPEQAQDYLRQAEMLRAMAATQKATTHNIFVATQSGARS